MPSSVDFGGSNLAARIGLSFDDVDLEEVHKLLLMESFTLIRFDPAVL